MGSLNRGRNPIAGGGPHHPAFTRAHQIGALCLVAVTFILTRAFDRLSCPLSSSSNSFAAISSSSSAPSLVDGSSGALNWPLIGFGPSLDLKIYVYDEGEIDGLRELMRGRDGKISEDACAKGQWGTQVLLSRHKNWNFPFWLQKIWLWTWWLIIEVVLENEFMWLEIKMHLWSNIGSVISKELKREAMQVA